MAESVTVLANAKLNLSLDVTGKRPDGYHTLEMVMQSINISDQITVTKCDEGITLNCSGLEVPENEQNLAYRAAELFFKEGELDGGAVIKLKKKIPVAAGLGGGSADAAAVLLALNELYGSHFEDEELDELAEKLGADVPFCLIGGTQLAEGVGSILSPLPTLQDCAFVIVKAGEKKSTADMYSQLDELEGEIEHPYTQDLVDAICEGDNIDAGRYMSNVFSSLWNFDDIREIMEDNGAAAVLVSGSGPSVFGYFPDIDNAKDAEDKLSDKYNDVYFCEPVDCGCEID